MQRTGSSGIRSMCHMRLQMRNNSFVASTDPGHDMPPQAHCHILELCRIVGPRDTCAVPIHRARRPLLLSIPETCCFYNNY